MKIQKMFLYKIDLQKIPNTTETTKNTIFFSISKCFAKTLYLLHSVAQKEQNFIFKKIFGALIKDLIHKSRTLLHLLTFQVLQNLKVHLHVSPISH